MTAAAGGGSIRRRLILQLLVVAAILSALLYLTVRSVADRAVETTQDSIIGAAAISIAEEIRGGSDGVEVDIAYATFSILGAVGDDRIFYRILLGADTITGYDTLPLPPRRPGGLSPVFYGATFLDNEVRIAAVERSVLAEGRTLDALVLVAQTQTSREQIVGRLANRAAALGVGFFAVAALLSVLTAGSVLRPVAALRAAVERRGPLDLRPVSRPVPAELAPLVGALNGFIGRLSTALHRTETFIAEAAHHIRTPLATLKAQSEIALHRAEDDATRAGLRAIIRSADDAARSASQLLDHAAVVYRTEQRADEAVDLRQIVGDVVASMHTTAEIRDVGLAFTPPPHPLSVTGDRLLIESAVRNLLDNAIKYTPTDGAVEVGFDSTPGRATLRICDNGRGLSGLDQSDLSRRFRRGANVDDVIGSGLGLTIVYEVARAHGGQFRLRERKEGGTCAEFSLPLR